MEDDPSSDYINANYIDVSGAASSIGERVRHDRPSLVCEAFSMHVFVNNMNTAFISLLQSKCLYSLTLLCFLSLLPMIWAVDMAVQGCKYHCRGPHHTSCFPLSLLVHLWLLLTTSARKRMRCSPVSYPPLFFDLILPFCCSSASLISHVLMPDVYIPEPCATVLYRNGCYIYKMVVACVFLLLPPLLCLHPARSNLIGIVWSVRTY